MFWKTKTYLATIAMQSWNFNSKSIFGPTLFMLRNKSPKNETIMNLISSAMSWSIFIDTCFETVAPVLKILRHWIGIKYKLECLSTLPKEKCYRRSVWVFLLVKTAISWYILFLFIYFSFYIQFLFSPIFMIFWSFHWKMCSAPIFNPCPSLYSPLPRF